MSRVPVKDIAQSSEDLWHGGLAEILYVRRAGGGANPMDKMAAGLSYKYKSAKVTFAENRGRRVMADKGRVQAKPKRVARHSMALDD